MKLVHFLKITNRPLKKVFISLYSSEDLVLANPPITLDQLSGYEWHLRNSFPPELLEHIKQQPATDFLIQSISVGPTRKSFSRDRDRMIEQLKAEGVALYNRPRKIPTPPIPMSKRPGYIPNQMWTNNPMRFDRYRKKVSQKMKERVIIRDAKGRIVSHKAKTELV